MAYDTYLVERVSNKLTGRKVGFESKKMFGGVCFMVDDKMCIGVVKDELMVRTDPAQESELNTRVGARPMDFTGKRMKGFLFIAPIGIDHDSDLDFWIDTCLSFNPIAKSSKK